MWPNQNPEQITRDAINAQLQAAGWVVQDKNAIDFPGCFLPEQQEIVRVLDEQFEAIERNKWEIDGVLWKSEALRQAILKKPSPAASSPNPPPTNPRPPYSHASAPSEVQEQQLEQTRTGLRLNSIEVTKVILI